MREADDAAVRCARVYIDTEGALKGERRHHRADPVRRADGGGRSPATYRASAGGTVAGRGDEQEITLFKSSGSALADLGAATLAHANFQGGRMIGCNRSQCSVD